MYLWWQLASHEIDYFRGVTWPSAFPWILTCLVWRKELNYQGNADSFRVLRSWEISWVSSCHQRYMWVNGAVWNSCEQTWFLKYWDLSLIIASGKWNKKIEHIISAVLFHVLCARYLMVFKYLKRREMFLTGQWEENNVLHFLFYFPEVIIRERYPSEIMFVRNWRLHSLTCIPGGSLPPMKFPMSAKRGSCPRFLDN